MTFKFYYYFQTQKMKVIKNQFKIIISQLLIRYHYDELKRLNTTL